MATTYLKVTALSNMFNYDAHSLEEERYQIWERVLNGTLWIYSDPVQRRGDLLTA